MPDAKDVVLTVPRHNRLEDWQEFDEVYVPGAGVPRQTEVGRRCWLRHDGRFRLTATIVEIRHRQRRPTRLVPGDRGPGWTLLVDEWEPCDLSDAEIGYDPGPASRGLRYLEAHPAPRRFRPRVRFVDPERIASEPALAHPASTVQRWQRVEARLVQDWIAWCEVAGRRVTRPEIRTEEGALLRGDAFDEARALLVEAKGSSAREHVRLAIGQVLDYSSLLGRPHTRAILVPDPIAPSLERLVAGLGIGVIHRFGAGFEEHLIPG